MKFGIRKYSPKKRLICKFSGKRFIRHSLGIKMPRNFSWLKNPRKYCYNKIYNRTSISVDSLFKLILKLFKWGKNEKIWNYSNYAN